MKKAFIKKTAVVLIGIAALTGCKDVFNDKDIKNNPNSPTDAPYDVLVSAAELGLAALLEDTDTRIAMMWAGQLAGTGRQHLTLAQYQVSSGTFGWDTYWNTVANARLIQEKTKPFNNRGPLGVAQVVEALVIAKLTALWGDIPYSQALNSDEFPDPKYDTQTEVYTQLHALLDDAIGNLESGVGNFGAAVDFIGNTDTGKWARAAHTLKARLYLHEGKYQSAIDEATLGIATTDGDLLIPHGDSYGVDLNWNNSFFTINRPGDTGFSYQSGEDTFLPTLMLSRTSGKTDESALFSYYFQRDLIVAESLDPNVNDDGFFAAKASHPVITFYENQLILAEAYARVDAAHENEAIDALNSVRSALSTGYINGRTIPATYVAEGLTYDPYDVADFPETEDLIKEILTEKYILMLGQYEVFTDIRRSKVATPAVTLGVPTFPGSGASSLPERYLYPQTEINTNSSTPNPPPGINVPMTFY